MRRGILILGALSLLLALGLARHPARAEAPAQAGPTPTEVTGSTPAGGGGALGTPYAPPNPPGGPGNGAPAGAGAATGSDTSGGAASPAPANLPGAGPNLAVGYFLPVCLILGLLVAGVSALVAIRRDAARAQRMRGPDAPDVR